MGWFGPSKEDVWRDLCAEIGAEFVEGSLWKGSKVQSHVGPWTLTLDTYTVSSGHSHVTFTRMRAPYVNPSGFRFVIYRKNAFSNFGKLLGMQDIEIGDPEFDDAFIIKGSDEWIVRDLFADSGLRALCLAQPKLHLEVRDSEGWFGPRFPADVDELQFRVDGVIKDVGQLRHLFDLFAAVLERLCRIGSAAKREPDVVL